MTILASTRGGVGLVRLSDSDFVLRNPEDDLRGKEVYDPEGQRVGGVQDLYFDPQEREVRFLEVGTGGLLGIGEKRILVPVETVVEVAQDWVAVEPGRKKTEGPAPFDTGVAPHRADSRRDEYVSLPYGDRGETADRLRSERAASLYGCWPH